MAKRNRTHCTCRCRCHPGVCAQAGKASRCGQCRKDGCYTKAAIAANPSLGDGNAFAGYPNGSVTL